MPQIYLLLFIVTSVLGKFKELFKGVKIAPETKKFIRFGLIGLAAYFLYKIISHAMNKTNALSDKDGALAVELHNAIYYQATNFHVPFFGDFHIGNGDEAACLLISERITDYNKTAKFYKDLYDVDLFADLEKILSSEELAKFSENVQRKNTSDTEVVTTTNPPKKSGNVTLIGKPVYCTNSEKVNIRSAAEPAKILYSVTNKETYYSEFGKAAGYVGNYVKERKITVNNVVYDAFEIDIPFEKQGFNFGLNGLIVKKFSTVKP